MLQSSLFSRDIHYLLPRQTSAHALTRGQFVIFFGTSCYFCLLVVSDHPNMPAPEEPRRKVAYIALASYLYIALAYCES